MLGSAMLLAAGKSTRIAPVGRGIPKPLLEVRGEPVLVRNLRWLATAGIKDVWVNLHYRGDLIRRVLGDGSKWHIRVHYSEESNLLGTAGGVRRVLSSLGETFLVVYGDNLVDFALDKFVEFHSRCGADVSVAVFSEANPNTGIAGGCVQLDQNGVVVGFVEDVDHTNEPPFVNAGVYAVQESALSNLAQGVFLDWGKDVFPRLLAKGARVLGYRIDGYCLGLDTPESYERGMQLVDSGRVTLR